MQRKPIHQQVIVVMGASSGIGRITALELARQGARVVVSARSETGLASLVQEIEQFGGEAVAAPADVTRFEQVQGVVERAEQHYGRLDTWIHLAAVSLYAELEQTTPEEFRQVIETNLVGAAYGAMAALPLLRQAEDGGIIFVSSVEAVRALPYQAAYAASKHGVKGLADALRVELRHSEANISVTNIMPASINTPLFDKARTKIGVRPKGLPPIYEPEQVADAILTAVEHPERDVIVGGAGKALVTGQLLLPGLVDRYLQTFGFGGQRSRQPKAADAPDNLYAPMEGDNRIHGEPPNLETLAKLRQPASESNGLGMVMASIAVGAVAAAATRMTQPRTPNRYAS
jgi:NAD(P)-dependent dehydrogenase (short-subunit alcohol dehydrogenase family)